MLRAFSLSLLGLAVAVGCGSSTSDTTDDGQGGEASGGSSGATSGSGGDSSGSSSGGASGSGGTATGGTSSGGTSSGGTSSGGTSSGGTNAGGTSTGGTNTGGTNTGGTNTGGTNTGGTSTGGSAGIGGTFGGTGGASTTDPDCPVNEPGDGSTCTDASLRCPYLSNGCRCLSAVGNGCYQLDTSCVPMMAAAAPADRIAPPPVHWCSCTPPPQPPLIWNCE